MSATPTTAAANEKKRHCEGAVETDASTSTSTSNTQSESQPQKKIKLDPDTHTEEEKKKNTSTTSSSSISDDEEDEVELNEKSAKAGSKSESKSDSDSELDTMEDSNIDLISTETDDAGDIDGMRKILKVIAATSAAIAAVATSTPSSSVTAAVVEESGPLYSRTARDQVDRHLQDVHLIPRVLSDLILDYVHHPIIAAYEQMERLCHQWDCVVEGEQRKSQPQQKNGSYRPTQMMKKYVTIPNSNIVMKHPDEDNSDDEETDGEFHVNHGIPSPDEIDALESLYRTRLKLPSFHFPDELKALWMIHPGFEFGDCEFTSVRLFPSMKRMRAIANDTPQSCTSSASYCLIDSYRNKGDPSERGGYVEYGDPGGTDELIRYDFITGCVYHIGVVDQYFWDEEKLKEKSYQGLRKKYPLMVGKEYYGIPVFVSVLFPSLAAMFEAINRELGVRLEEHKCISKPASSSSSSSSSSSVSSSSTSVIDDSQIDCETLIRLAYPLIRSQLSKAELSLFHSEHWFLKKLKEESVTVKAEDSNNRDNTKDKSTSSHTTSTITSSSSSLSLASIRRFLTASERAFLNDARARGVTSDDAYWDELNVLQGLM